MQRNHNSDLTFSLAKKNPHHLDPHHQVQNTPESVLGQWRKEIPAGLVISTNF
jgi:hypothetical protein